MMQRLALALLLLAAPSFMVPAAFAAAPAHHAQATKTQAVVSNYVTAKDIPALPAPPRSTSRTHRTAIKQILGTQAYTTPEEIAAARDEQNLRPERMTRILGSDFSRANLPLTFALLDRAGADVGAVTSAAKKRWHTTRPYRLDRRIKLLVDPLPKDNYGYPSGHASTSAVWAQILAQLEPAAASKLQHAADRIAGHRVLVGVHTSYDIEGGKKLAAMVFDAMNKNPAFQVDLAAARAEYAAYRATQMLPTRKNWKSFKSRITE